MDRDINSYEVNTGRKMVNVEYIVTFVMNSVMKDNIKSILNQELTQITSIKDNN